MVLPSVDVYVFAHPDYFKQALITDVDAFGKTEDFRRAFGDGLISTTGEQWSRQRDILQPLFQLIEKRVPPSTANSEQK